MRKKADDRHRIQFKNMTDDECNESGCRRSSHYIRQNSLSQLLQFTGRNYRMYTYVHANGVTTVHFLGKFAEYTLSGLTIAF